MLRPTLTASALAALLIATACDQNPTQQAQKQSGTDQQAMQETTPSTPSTTEPAPGTAETTTGTTSGGIANELAQATGQTESITQQDIAGGQKADNVNNPASTLADASVRNRAGESVGEVRAIIVGPTGKADKVVVEVGGFLNVGERAVAIDAKRLTFLPNRKILIVELSKSDLQNMPAAPATTTPTPGTAPQPTTP